jgi:hypothetical protein
MTEDMIQQVFYCSFISAVQGSYYWEQVDKAERDQHFKDIPYDPKLGAPTEKTLASRFRFCANPRLA